MLFVGCFGFCIAFVVVGGLRFGLDDAVDGFVIC